MRITVYLDLIFIINFIADFYVLIITGWLAHEKINIIRIGLGALFGSALLLPFLLYPKLLMGFSGVLIMTGISMGAVAISLGANSGLIKKWFLSTTIMVLFGGTFQLLRSRFGVLHITFYTWLIFISISGIIVIIIISCLTRYRQEKENICRIYIHNQGRYLEEDVLIDTGNRLWDVRFNRPVMLLSEDAVRDIISHKEYCLIKEYKTKGCIDYNNPILLESPKTCFHEISFQSVGKVSGRLLCFLLEEVVVVKATGDTAIKGEANVIAFDSIQAGRDCSKRYEKQPCAVVDAGLFEGKSYKGLLFSDNI